ncbi:cathepsin C, putative [Eimeria tenella]|uniref:dipeptidyl-peptidase I n=2 Tax=Eimeria tenella TaxID=5802 RepID=U6KVZ8_EIMTE|nr:cathepsin C, putative [Eimeria tenella]CDJ40514.1 cathepsin C, putative [Eimeria tenella]|eukprot:XP_013231264.1 cathepsin C, putative [Eimeria tenella]
MRRTEPAGGGPRGRQGPLLPRLLLPLLLLLCCSSSLLLPVAADLPIHATIKDMKGHWTFLLTPPVTGAIQSCGSGAPNKNTENLEAPVADSRTYLSRHGGVSTALELELSDETVPLNWVYDTKDNLHRNEWKMLAVKDKEKKVVGGWTAVYDEGFEVHLTNKTRLFAILKYSVKQNCPEAKDGDLEDSNGETVCYSTDPSKTQLGWYSSTAADGSVASGCFFGEKEEKDSAAAAAAFVVLHQRAAAAQQQEAAAAAAGGAQELSYFLSEDFVLQHNSKKSSWIAAVNSSFANQNKNFLNSLLKQFQSSPRLLGSSEGGPVFLEEAAEDAASTQAFACPCKEGEKALDTRSKSAAAAAAVLSPVSLAQEESKAKTKTVPVKAHSQQQQQQQEEQQQQQLQQMQQQQEAAVKLSPQSVLSCSFYNQGCHGGLPYLVGKHATEIGILDEQCMPYTAMDLSSCPVLNRNKNEKDFLKSEKDFLKGEINGSGEDSSSNAAFLLSGEATGTCHQGENRWFAKGYGYVGGCYECLSCSAEQKIMKEIMTNGPVAAALDAPPSLFAYSSGVYTTRGAPHARVCDLPGAPSFLPTSSSSSSSSSGSALSGWEYTNHAVTIVGWGETGSGSGSDPQKYWIVRNTWGPQWGLKGFFLLERGNNSGGIENQTSFIDPDLTRGKGLALASASNQLAS